MTKKQKLERSWSSSSGILTNTDECFTFEKKFHIHKIHILLAGFFF